MVKKALMGLWATCVLLTGFAGPAQAAGTDIVLYATDTTNLHGNWAHATDATAAAGQTTASADLGWSSTDSALAAPTNYFDAVFSANAGTPYHVWLRLRATADSKYNDSVFVQFSDAVNASGAALFPIGTTNGLLVNLQSCNGCALSGWGWMDGAYWLSQTSTLQFASSGTHTMRIQTREDGVQIDQIVLSPSTYLTTAPGPMLNDNTIVPKPVVPVATSYFTPTPTLPGTIEAENFDNGGEGLAYHDTTPANLGGAYRQTGVDIEASTENGYDVGWISAGEWLGYTVNVPTTGLYNFQARVASSGQGGTFHLESAGVNLTGALTIPNTGGWQTWTTLSSVVTLAAGQQQLQVVFDTSGPNAVGNVNWFSFSPAASTPYSGTAIAIPGSFPAANFDQGGEGLAYHDTTPGNSGGAYRATDVDLEGSSLGGIDVGWIADGEWLAYSVNVASAGNYIVTLQVASPGAAGMVHAQFGATGTTSTAVPNTGGWQNWTTITLNATLAAGPQVMKLMVDTGGFNMAGVSVQAAPVVVITSAPPPPPPPPPPVTTGNVVTVHAGDDLQAAIDQAMPGDTLMLDAGATFTGNFLLPAKSGTAVVTIRSAAADAVLPGATTRIDPSYAALLPKLQSPNSLPALATEAGAHDYDLIALEFLANPMGYYDMLDLGDGSSAQNTLDSVPHDLVIDRVYMHGDVALGQKRAIGLNSASTTIENCYIAEIKAQGQDSQAIAGWNGPGPYTIVNNYLEAAGEDVLFGGSDPSIVNLVPSNITITGNYITKQVAWQGKGWQVKNGLELKNAEHLTITGNTIENTWADAQTGALVLFTVRNQDGTAPWSTIADVTFSNNVVRHGGAFLSILGLDDTVGNPSVRMVGVEVSNNLIYDIDPQEWKNPVSGQWALGRLIQILGGPQTVDISHNTVLAEPNSSPTLNSAITMGEVGDTYLTQGLTIRNNVMAEGYYGLIGDTVGTGTPALDTYAPGWVWSDNLIIRGTSGANYSYPATTTLNTAGTNVVDPIALTVLPSFSSTPTTDGKAIGADIGALQATIPGLDLTK